MCVYFVYIYISRTLLLRRRYARQTHIHAHVTDAHKKHSRRHDTIRNENERICAREATIFFRGSPEYALKFARSGRSTNVAPHINKHVPHKYGCTAFLEPGECTYDQHFLSPSLSISPSISVSTARFLRVAFALSIPRTGRPGCAISLSLSLYILLFPSLFVEPTLLPTRHFSFLSTPRSTHTRKRMLKCTRNTAAEQPKQSRANGARATPSYLSSLSSSLTPSSRRRGTHNAHFFSQHTHTHIHTYALSLISSFARSVGRSPLTRERDTPGWFSSTVPSARWSGRRVSNRVAPGFGFASQRLLSPRRENRARRPRIFARHARDGRKRDAQRDNRASLVTKHSRRTATHGYDGASAEIGTTRPRSVASAAHVRAVDMCSRRHVTRLFRVGEKCGFSRLIFFFASRRT